jgi:hypothetical protein
LFEQSADAKNFVQMDFTMASSDAEQIAINDFAMATDSDSKVSACAQNMTAPVNAINILRGKINFFIDVVKGS